MIFDEILAVVSNGEGASGVENDVDHVVICASRKESRDKVGIKVRALNV